MKQLKDYLHLYLWCECVRVKNKYPYKKGDTFVLTPASLPHYFLSTDIKPILRHLSDMKESDYSEWVEIEKVNLNDRYGQTRWEAERTKFLLSKHFDLFGLIEAGLAIDKTTLIKKGVA